MALLFSMGLFILMLVLIGAMFFIFWLMMLIDSITRKFKDGTDKVIWVLVNILLGLLGSLIYYFVIFSKDKSKSIKWIWWTLLILIVLMIVFLIFGILVNVKAY